MRKEVSIAIIIGIILGAIILYGINLANKTTESLPKVTPTPTATVPESTTSANTPSTPKATQPLINSHTDNQVLFEKETTLAGKTTPSSQISIIWEDGENLTTTDSSGNYSQAITLIPGENNIQVAKLNSDKTIQKESLKIYYSTKPIE